MTLPHTKCKNAQTNHVAIFLEPALSSQMVPIRLISSRACALGDSSGLHIVAIAQGKLRTWIASNGSGWY
eukprot:1166193-Amphidinium_carterae.1